MSAVLQILPALALLTGALLLLRWWANRGLPNRAAGLRVTGRTALGRATTVGVVEVDGRRFLVGGSEHDVTLLAELDASDAEGTDATSEETPGASPRPRRRIGAPARRRAHHLVPTVPGRDRSAPGPRTGLLDQLRAMTVRSHVGRPSGAPPLD